MSNSYQFNQYSVLTACGDRTVYIKIIDTQCFICYEGNFDNKDLNTNLKINDIYKIINTCFAQKNKDYNIDISVNTGLMKLSIDAIVGGFLQISFIITLREKLMSNDGQLTYNFTKLEQYCKNLEQTLDELIEWQNNVMVPICYIDTTSPMYGHHYYKPVYYKACTTKLELSYSNPSLNQYYDEIIYEHIQQFYNLKELKITGHFSNAHFEKLENKTLEELRLQLDGQGNNIASLQGIQQRLPNLRSLIIHSAPSLKDIPIVLASVPHKIDKISIKLCGAINVVELQTYCQTNNINLEIA